MTVDAKEVHLTSPDEVYVGFYQTGIYWMLYSEWGKNADVLRDRINTFAFNLTGKLADGIWIFRCKLDEIARE